jgi:hypothetical protein
VDLSELLIYEDCLCGAIRSSKPLFEELGEHVGEPDLTDRVWCGRLEDLLREWDVALRMLRSICPSGKVEHDVYRYRPIEEDSALVSLAFQRGGDVEYFTVVRDRPLLGQPKSYREYLQRTRVPGREVETTPPLEPPAPAP